MDFTELKAQFEGTEFRQLVQHHLRRQSQDERIQGLQGTIALLPSSVRGLAEGFIDRWNPRAYDEAFWRRDTASVFDEIIADARDVLRPVGLASDDDAAFNLFNVLVINYAHNACDQPKMRRFMRITVHGFPWPSTAALFYPVAATVYIATTSPADTVTIVGYGLANLGYLLFGAGIVSGTFRILGLNRRWQVFATAVVAFGVGTVLSNLGA